MEMSQTHCYATVTITLLWKRHQGLIYHNIFKPTIGNESSHEISNDIAVRVVNFATSKNLLVKSTMFPHPSIHKYTWTSLDGQTHNQIDHVLIDRRRHSSILDVRSFRGADCDTNHYLVVANIRERLAVSKRPLKKGGYV
jgi:hypothetical protein